MTENLPALRQDVGPSAPPAAAPAPAFEQVGPEPGVPVAVTDAHLATMRRAYGPETADKLQSAWRDRTLHRLQEIRALAEDHPRFDEILARHETPDGGLSMAGIEAAADYLAEQAGLESADDLAKRHPELHAIFQEERTHEGITPAGIYRGLAYVARSSGYRFAYGAVPQQRQEQRTMTDTPNEGKPVSGRESFATGMNDFSRRIEDAQARGNSKLANELYQEQQRWIATVKGNAPIIDGRRRTA